MMFCSPAHHGEQGSRQAAIRYRKFPFYSTTDAILEAGNLEEEQLQGKMIETIKRHTIVICLMGMAYGAAEGREVKLTMGEGSVY